MYTFVVDDVKSAYEELVKKGVKFIAEPSVSPTKEFYYATLQDLDGNTLNICSFNL